jgi:hypothetical protein
VPVDSHELGKIDRHDSEEDLVGRWFQKEWLPMQTQENTETLVNRMSENCQTYKKNGCKTSSAQTQTSILSVSLPAKKPNQGDRFCLVFYIVSAYTVLLWVTHMQVTVLCPGCFICRMP